MNPSPIHSSVLEPVTAAVADLAQAWASATPADRLALDLAPAREALTVCALRLADAYTRVPPSSVQRQDLRTLYDAVQAALDMLGTSGPPTVQGDA